MGASEWNGGIQWVIDVEGARSLASMLKGQKGRKAVEQRGEILSGPLCRQAGQASRG